MLLKPKVSEAMKRLWSNSDYRTMMISKMANRKRSKETCENQSKRMMGHVVSEETRNKISKSNKEVYKNCLRKETLDGLNLARKELIKDGILDADGKKK